MRDPRQITEQVQSQFPIGSRVRLNLETSGRFSPLRWLEREGEVVGHARRTIDGPLVILLVVWDGRTRRRINRAHYSHFVRIEK